MKKSILQGTILITVISIIAKAIGIFFRVPVTKILGEVGIGIYYFPIQFIAPIIAIITSPSIAIARLISDEQDDSKQRLIFSVAKKYMTYFGMIMSLVMLLLAPILIHTIWTREVLLPYLALIPAPLFLALSSAYKGYHQGVQDMKPIAILQFTDGIGRLILGLSMTVMLLSISIEFGAAGATFGTTAGAVLGFVFIKKYTPKDVLVPIEKSHEKGIRHLLMEVSLPIIISALGVNLMNFIDSLLIKSRLLTLGYENYDILRFNGILSSVNTIISIPLAIGIAINLNALPNITAAAKYGLEYMNHRIRSAMIMIATVAIPSGVGLFLVGKNVFRFIYSGVSDDHFLIEIYSLSVIFVMINLGLTTVLQGKKKERIPVKNMYIGIVVKLILSFILLSIKDINIHGTAISTTIAYGLVMVLNFISALKLGFKLDVRYMVVVPVFSSLIMGIVVYLIMKIGETFLFTFISILAGVGVYGVLMLLFKVVAPKDIPILKGFINEKS